MLNKFGHLRPIEEYLNEGELNKVVGFSRHHGPKCWRTNLIGTGHIRPFMNTRELNDLMESKDIYSLYSHLIEAEQMFERGEVENVKNTVWRILYGFLEKYHSAVHYQRRDTATTLKNHLRLLPSV